ncbi:class I histocompatibility antigen, F10 alpha chain-like [Cetorhinus maximus]
MQRDGAKVEEIHSTEVRPNHDGTYQIQNLMEFDPKDQAKFSCVVDQGGLNGKMVMFYEPKADFMVPIIVSVVIAVLLVALAIVGFVFYKKKAGQKTGYNPAKTSDKGDSSSSSSANA